MPHISSSISGYSNNIMSAMSGLGKLCKFYHMAINEASKSFCNQRLYIIV